MNRTRLDLDFLTFLMIKGEEIRKLIILCLSLCYLLKYIIGSKFLFALRLSCSVLVGFEFGDLRWFILS